jgi:hypothetical protein
MGRVARRAATGRLLRMSGRAAQRARAVAHARPVGSWRARHGPWLFRSYCAWAESNFACRVLAHFARPKSTGLGDLVQMTEDGRTGQVLSGQTVERSGGIVCGLHHT